MHDGPRVLAALTDSLAARVPALRFDPAYTDGAPRPDGQDAPPLGPPNPYYCVEEPPFVLPEPRAVPAPPRCAAAPCCSGVRGRLPAAARRGPLPARPAPCRPPHPQPRRQRQRPLRRLAGPRVLLVRRLRARRARHPRLLGLRAAPVGTAWWNFDAPPGWQKLTSAPLADVAAHQWAGAHAAILDGLAALPGRPDVLRVRFEDVIRSPRTRAAALARILRFAGLAPHPPPPGRCRWLWPPGRPPGSAGAPGAT
ncbi:hypothetical protein NKH77_31835 [Streptomyces sp. M19]